MGVLRKSIRHFYGYALALLVAICVFALQWAIRPWVGDRIPFLFVLPALIFVATAVGRGPAILVLVAGALNATLLASPQGNVEHGRIALVLYGGLGLLLVFYGGQLRFTTFRAALAERRLQLAQENTGVGVFELDFLNNTAFVSPSLCQILGQPVMEGPIPLERWLNALHPNHVDESLRVLQDKVDRGELRYEREQCIQLNSGEVRWVLNRVRLDVTPAGKLAQARGAAVDITDRKRVDDLLRHSQTELSLQVEDLRRLHSLSQSLIAPSENLQIPLQALLELVVHSHGASFGLMTIACTDTRPIVARVGISDADVSLISTHLDNRIAAIASTGRSAGFECEEVAGLHRSLAERLNLGTVHTTPVNGPLGDVVGAISVMFAEDHTSNDRQSRLREICAATAAALVGRERAKIAAEAIEKRFEVALESCAVPFNILAPVRDAAGFVTDFRWSYVNPAAARALGSEAHLLRDRCIGELLPLAWDAPDLFNHYVAVVDRTERRDFEVRSVATGRGGWYRVTASPLHGSAAVWFADITEQKLREAAMKEENRRKDEFLATLAHELRNPLAPIRQALMIARMANAPESKKIWSHQVIDRQVRNMALLLDDLLDVSRIATGKLELRRASVSLADVVDAAAETALPSIEAKQHQFTIDIPEVPVMLLVDALRVAQVLGNLLTNAAKYSDPGSCIELTVRRDGDGLTFVVTDNGIGLSAEQQTHLFEMFSQFRAAIDRSQGGLGIGLALSRNLVEMHGGTITVSSPGLGKGSAFRVWLPESCVVESMTTALSMSSEQAAAHGNASVK